MWQLQSKLQKPGRRSEECFFHYQCRSAWWKIFFAMPNLYFNVKSQPTILSFLFFFSEFLLTQVIVVEASWLNGADFEIIWHQSCHFCYILHRCLGLLIKLHVSLTSVLKCNSRVPSYLNLYSVLHFIVTMESICSVNIVPKSWRILIFDVCTLFSLTSIRIFT